jgi:hypothetical protein
VAGVDIRVVIGTRVVSRGMMDPVAVGAAARAIPAYSNSRAIGSSFLISSYGGSRVIIRKRNKVFIKIYSLNRFSSYL